MVRSLVGVEDTLVLDPAKHYKQKGSILVSLNESKLQSPIVLVDPTWKERNALAALSLESFRRFQKAARSFLKKPSIEFFEVRPVDVTALKRLASREKAEFVVLELETDRQAGDIAGTKLRKASRFVEAAAREFYDLLGVEFEYSGEHSGKLYLVGRSKKEVWRKGPLPGMKKHVAAFRKENKKVEVRDGRLWSRVRVGKSLKKFLEGFLGERKGQLEGMGISGFEVV